MKKEPYRVNIETTDKSAINIHSMRDMSDVDYKKYISTELFYVDSDGVLRYGLTDNPIATSREQFEICINELIEMKSYMFSK